MEENATARCRRYDPRYKVRCILGPDQDHTHEHDAFVVELPVGVECSADVTPEQSIDALDDALRHARNALWDAQHELRLANEDARTANLALDKAEQAMAELDELREQVRILEGSENAEIVRLNGIVAEQQRLLGQADAALLELKQLVLIGPLTAEEWLEFRLLPDEEEERELLKCCANTSAIRDDVFLLMRSNAEDPLLGRLRMRQVMHGVNMHHDLIEGDHPAARRLLELLTRMCAYYDVPLDYVHEEVECP